MRFYLINILDRLFRLGRVYEWVYLDHNPTRFDRLKGWLFAKEYVKRIPPPPTMFDPETIKLMTELQNQIWKVFRIP